MCSDQSTRHTHHSQVPETGCSCDIDRLDGCLLVRYPMDWDGGLLWIRHGL